MNTHRLSLDEKLVAGILDYYEFDKTWLSNMQIDMEELYPKQYSILKRKKVLNNILKNPNRIQKIQDHIRRGFQYFRGMRDAARLKAIEFDMQQEEIINQIKRSNYVDSDAIRAWYFRLHPKYTPLEIINYHHAALEKMGREWFQNLTLWQQYEVEIKATQVYELHQLNYEEKKKKMVYDLHEELLVLLGEKVLPQYCRLVIETMYIKKKSFIEDEVNEKEKRLTYKIKDDKITKVYDRLAKIESAYNNQVKVGIEQVVKEVFFAHSSMYAASDIRFWVREFFAENVDRDRPTYDLAISDEKNEPNVVPKIVVDRERKNCSHELGKTSCIFEPKILSYRDEACRLDNLEMKNEISRYSLEVVEKVRKEINDALDRRKDHLIHDATAKHFSKILSECDEIHLKASCQIDRRFVTTPLEPPLPEKRELPRPNVAKYLPKSGSPTKTVDFPRRRFSKTTPPKRTDSGSTDRIQQETERPDSALRIGSVSDSETNRPGTAAPMRRFSRMRRPSREKKPEPTDPGSADRRQQETKSSGRSRPMRRLSSLTSSNSTEFWSTDKTQEETKSSGRMIPRPRPSTVTTPKSTDPGPSPKLASGPVTMESKPTGIRRTLSFDKTVVQQSPEKAKNTSLDDELSDLTSPKSTDPGPSPKPASAPKTIEAKSPRKGIKRTLSTDKKVVRKSPKKTKDTSSDDEEDELPQKRL